MGVTMKDLVLATRNKGKIEEFRRILDELAPGSIRLLGLEKFPETSEVDETGETFEENALLKARAIENQAFVIACNGTGDELGGESQVIDPWGVNLSSLSRKEDVLFENIDLQLSNNIREKMPFLADRVIT
jgi:hypothetical protein